MYRESLKSQHPKCTWKWRKAYWEEETEEKAEMSLLISALKL